MIRKPDNDWHQQGEDAVVRTVRTAAAVVRDGRKVGYHNGAAAAGLMCCAIAIFWGSLGIPSASGLPAVIGHLAMVGGMGYLGYRLLLKARPSGN